MALAHRPESLRPGSGPLPAPSLAEAFERAFAAGEQLASDRLALLLFELRVRVAGVGGAAVLGLVAGIAGLLGWIGIAVALALWSWGGLPLEGRLALIAAGHLLLALLLGTWARRRLGTLGAAEDDDDSPSGRDEGQ
jgi:hypothetical protein